MRRRSLIVLLLSALMVMSPALCAFADTEAADNTSGEPQQEVVTDSPEAVVDSGNNEDDPAAVEGSVPEDKAEETLVEEPVKEEVQEEQPAMKGETNEPGWSEDGNCYYDENGDSVKGWIIISDEEGTNHWYNFDGDGNLVKSEWVPDSKGLCWVGPNGYMIEKTQWILVGDEWYYIEKGYQVRNKWKKDSKGWCYLGGDGRMVTKDWVPDSKGLCWVGPDGYMVEKNQWISVEDDWYYIEKGYQVRNKWKKDSKGWCYLGGDGRMVTNDWAPDSKGWCWIGPNGYMVETSGWKQIGDDWYYLEKGYRAQDRWLKDSTGWRHVGEDGRMDKNEQIPDSKGWCWVDENGYQVVDQWVVERGRFYYYVDSSGYQVENKRIWIGAKNGYQAGYYTFDEDGRCTVTPPKVTN